MTAQPHDIDELLVKVMLHEASAEDQQVVDNWLAESEANRHYFAHFKLIWSQSSQLATTSSADEDIAWSRLQHRIQNAPLAAPAKLIKLHRFSRTISVAALFILAIVTAGIAYLLLKRSSTSVQIVKSGNFTKKDTLPDGSVITLNKNSTISYPKPFAENMRNVQLEGEAFFDVARNKQKPFVIKTKDASILVTGTSFNVNATAKNTQVIVETGTVQVRNKKKEVTLKATEQVVVSADDTVIAKRAVADELHNYYRTKLFVCKGTTLERLGEILTIAYGIHITIPDQNTRQLKLNTTFNDVSLNTIVSIICKTFDLTATQHDNTIIIK